jgi:hypothetical protein
MHKTNWIRALLTLPAIAAMSLHAAAQQVPAQRTLQPADLFRVQRVGTTAWSPDGRYVSIEFSRPGRVLGGTLPCPSPKLNPSKVVDLNGAAGHSTDDARRHSADRGTPNGPVCA